MRRLTLALLFFGLCCCAEEDVPFKQVLEPRPFSFPADHASHSGYQTEWWYVTGNVQDEAGKNYGYQFTIFRRALDSRDAAARGRASAWAAGDFYLLHLAVSAIDFNEHASAESLQRGVLRLAGATDFKEATAAQTPVRVWMKGAEFVRTANGWSVKAQAGELALDLNLLETLPPVLHGADEEAGLSRKGPRPGQASYYYSVPFLKTTGTLGIGAHRAVKIVSGRSWMDHEFGSNQLSAEQAGWAWFSVQFNDGRALMLYLLRNKDGGIEPRSSGTWIEKDGRARHLNAADFTLVPGRVWKSPRGGAEYPIEWTLKLPALQAELNVNAAMDDQEFNSEKGAGVNYYEGAVRMGGQVGGAGVSGDGYLEITAGTLGGRL